MRTLDILTPQAAPFQLRLADIPSRALALLVDTLIQICAMLLLALGFIGAASVQIADLSSWYLGAMLVALLAVYAGYHLIFEGALHGRTPGKLLLGLRVVDRYGRPIGWGASCVRNLFRLVDMLPFYTVALVSAFASASCKRLGDLVAGTYVVYAPRGRQVAMPQAAPAAPRRFPLSPEDYALVENFLARRGGMAPRARTALAARLAQRTAGAVGAPPALQAAGAEPFLLTLYRDNGGDPAALAARARRR